MSERISKVLWAFSTKAQSAYGTAVGDGDLTLSHLFKGPDIAEITPDIMTDEEEIGKGHEWSENQEIESWDGKLKRSFDMTSLLAGWIGAFGLGAVTTTQPDSVGAPNTYDHSCRFNVASQQNPVISVVESLSTGIKRKVRDLAIADFTLSGEGKKRIEAEANFLGSGFKETSSLSMPSLNVGGSFLRMSGLQFEVGPTGSEVDVSDRLKLWRWHVDNDLQGDDGFYPGSGLYRGRCEYGTRKQELSFTVLLNSGSQELTDLESNNYLKLILTCQGSLIETTYYHQYILTLPRISYKAVQIGTDGPFLVFNIECNIHYDSTSTYPVDFTVRNNQATYLV